MAVCRHEFTSAAIGNIDRTFDDVAAISLNNSIHSRAVVDSIS